MNNSLWWAILYEFVPVLPVMIVLIVGFILAIINYRRARKPALLAMAGIILLMVSRLGFAAISLATVRFGMDFGVPLSKLLMMVETLRASADSLGLACLLAAVFLGRSELLPQVAAKGQMIPQPYDTNHS